MHLLCSSLTATTASLSKASMGTRVEGSEREGRGHRHEERHPKEAGNEKERERGVSLLISHVVKRLLLFETSILFPLLFLHSSLHAWLLLSFTRLLLTLATQPAFDCTLTVTQGSPADTGKKGKERWIYMFRLLLPLLSLLNLTP